ncbi:MAG: hypothetical protein V2I45_12025 [Halieaceae bacterium]|nr:hypothetical protein [Halieaceae bacterium]
MWAKPLPGVLLFSIADPQIKRRIMNIKRIAVTRCTEPATYNKGHPDPLIDSMG